MVLLSLAAVGWGRLNTKGCVTFCQPSCSAAVQQEEPAQHHSANRTISQLNKHNAPKHYRVPTIHRLRHAPRRGGRSQCDTVWHAMKLPCYVTLVPFDYLLIRCSVMNRTVPAVNVFNQLSSPWAGDLQSNLPWHWKWNATACWCQKIDIQYER